MSSDFNTSEAEGDWVIIPVKELAQGKSRLAPYLTTNQHSNLTLNLIKHTFELMKSMTRQQELAGILVVSTDALVLKEAEKYGLWALPEDFFGLAYLDQTDRLNAVLKAATGWLIKRVRPTKLLILPCDLPLLTVADVQAVVALDYPTEAVLAPDWAGKGTNALALCLQTALDFEFLFGVDSFMRHQQALADKGVTFSVCKRPGLAFDLDQLQDLNRLPTSLKERLLAA